MVLNKKKSHVHRTAPVKFRNYSKGVFTYPLCLYSFIAFIIEWLEENGYIFHPTPTTPNHVLAAIWLIFFFGNIFVLSFDFSTGKFLTLIFIILAIVLIVVIVTIQNPTATPTNYSEVIGYLNLGLTAEFYLYATILTGLILFVVCVAALSSYVEIGQNEILVKGFFGGVERFPTASLKLKESITDVFEYIALRAGTFEFDFGANTTLKLDTVPFYRKRRAEFDDLLSVIAVSNEDNQAPNP